MRPEWSTVKGPSRGGTSGDPRAAIGHWLDTIRSDSRYRPYVRSRCDKADVSGPGTRRFPSGAAIRLRGIPDGPR
jgi:hypothetical protein